VPGFLFPARRFPGKTFRKVFRLSENISENNINIYKRGGKPAWGSTSGLTLILFSRRRKEERLLASRRPRGQEKEKRRDSWPLYALQEKEEEKRLLASLCP